MRRLAPDYTSKISRIWSGALEKPPLPRTTRYGRKLTQDDRKNNALRGVEKKHNKGKETQQKTNHLTSGNNNETNSDMYTSI